MKNQNITSQILKEVGIDAQGKVTLYKYIDFKGAISMLENNTFKFSRVKDFNDPFDLYDSIIDFSKFAPISVQYKSRQEKRNVEKAPLKKKLLLLHRLWKSNKNNFGITCLSKTFDNILMWSHYADKHRGVCLGIEIDVRELMNDNFLTLPVLYKDEFEQIPYFVSDEIKRLEAINTYLSTKAIFWSYEKEVRIVNLEYFKTHNSSYLKFEKYATLKEVLLGFKMGDNDKNKIKRLIKNRKIKTFEMVNCKNQFAISKK